MVQKKHMSSIVHFFIRSQTGIRLVLLLAVTTGLIWATVIVRARTKARQTALTPVMALSAAQTGNGKERTPIVLLNLTRFGFEPAEMTIPAGKCLLAIRNLTGLDTVDLEVTRKAGNKLLEEKSVRGKRHWEKALELTPGEYLIAETSTGSGWSFKLLVTPRNR